MDKVLLDAEDWSKRFYANTPQRRRLDWYSRIFPRRFLESDEATKIANRPFWVTLAKFAAPAERWYPPHAVVHQNIWNLEKFWTWKNFGDWAMHDLQRIIVPRSDREIAEGYRARLVEAHKPVFEILDEARAAGFEISFSSGPGPDGKIEVQLVRVMKVL